MDVQCLFQFFCCLEINIIVYRFVPKRKCTCNLAKNAIVVLCLSQNVESRHQIIRERERERRGKGNPQGSFTILQPMLANPIVLHFQFSILSN